MGIDICNAVRMWYTGRLYDRVWQQAKILRLVFKCRSRNKFDKGGLHVECEE